MNQIATVDYDKIKYRLYERNGSLVLSLQLIRQEYDEFNHVVDKTVDFYVVKEPRNIKEILATLANSTKHVSLQAKDLITNDRDGNQLIVKNYKLLQKRRELKYFSNKLEKKIEKAKLKKKCKNVKVHDKENKILKIKHIAHGTATALGVIFTIGGAAAATKNNSNHFPFFPNQVHERRVDAESSIDKKEQSVSLEQSLSEGRNSDYESGVITASSSLEDTSSESLPNEESNLTVQAVDIGTDTLSEQLDAVISNEENISSESDQSIEKEDMKEEQEESLQTKETTLDEQELMNQIDQAIEQANEDMKVDDESKQSLEQSGQKQEETEEIQFDVSKEETDESLKGSLATEEDIKSIEAASQAEVENIIDQGASQTETVIIDDAQITEIAKQMLASNATPEEIEHVANALVSGENLNATPQYGVNYIEKYNLTPEQIDVIKATVRHEAGADPRENYAVMSTVIRRCESGAWGGGNNPYGVITASGQFESYLKGYYKQYINGQYPECTDEIVDAMLTGQLEPFHDKERFSSGEGATGEQYTSNGNHFR